MVNKWKKLPGVVHMREMNAGAMEGMSGLRPTIAEEPLTMCSAVGETKIIAVVSTWNDEDIIGASCIHLKQQGVDRIVILDNDSSDGSVSEAINNGADEGRIYSTEFYDDDLRIRLQNEIARDEVLSAKGSCWVLSLDADEFVHGWKGDSIRNTLSSLPPQFRTVGSWSLDLYPESPSGYIRLTHPLQSMTHGVLRRSDFCGKWHWKHVALRYTDGIFDLSQTRGNHIPAGTEAAGRVYEPSEINLPLIHAPWRNRAEAEWRLNLLCGGGKARRSKMDDDVTGSGGAIRRLKNLENVYGGLWDRVELPHCEMMYGKKITGIVPYPYDKYFPEIRP